MGQGNKGFGIMQMMVAMAIMAVATIGLVSMLSTSFKGVKTVEMDRDIDQFVSEIQNVLADAGKCDGNLAGIDFDGGDVASITDIGGTGQVLSTGNTFGDSRFTLNRMQLSVAGLPTPPAPAAGVADRGIVNLLLTFQKDNPLNRRVIGPSLVARTIRLNVLTTAADTVDDCHATAQTDTDIWQRHAAVPSDIFYMDNVAIGIDQSAAGSKFDVRGDIRASGVSGNIVAEGAGAFSGGITSNSDVVLSAGDLQVNNGDIMASGDISSGGDVIVDGVLRVPGVGVPAQLVATIGGTVSATGNVAVDGRLSSDVLIAGTNPSCDGTKLGAIGYLGGSIQFCHNDGWRQYKRVGPPICAWTAVAPSNQCAANEVVRGVRSCVLVGATVQCQIQCCNDGY